MLLDLVQRHVRDLAILTALLADLAHQLVVHLARADLIRLRVRVRVGVGVGVRVRVRGWVRVRTRFRVRVRVRVSWVECHPASR